MRADARVQAAIEILDRIFAGAPAEQALTNWARGARYAGSKDRAAVRDHVFDALRRRRSACWVGGAETGRAAMLGLCQLQGADLEALFTGATHAPAGVTEALRDLTEAPEAVQADLPDWLLPEMKASLGAAFFETVEIMRSRAPVFLRVNLGKASVEEAARVLSAEEIQTQPHGLASTALEVTQNARRVQASQAFQSGLVELQDAASQALVEALPRAARVLDYCAGGGGKALALAAMGADVTAHDAHPQRMRDISARAARAGVKISECSTQALTHAAPFDLVLCDAPCSGSGSWRRAPDGKWRLSAERLSQIRALQLEILRDASTLVAPGGVLAYATCSVLQSENSGQAAAFAEFSGWHIGTEKHFLPGLGGDGFYLALFQLR